MRRLGLMNGKELSLIKLFRAKKDLTVEAANSYIEVAENAISRIITLRQVDKNAYVTTHVTQFQTACSKGGITKPQQEEIIQVQAGKYFELSFKEQQLAEDEAEEKKQFDKEEKKR